VELTARKIAYSGLFTALTAVGAFIRIPMPLVPFSMQTFFVYMSGTVLGASGGFISQFVYLFLGLAGLPIFARGGGLGYIVTPTFGYLLSYPLAALVIGKLTSKMDVKKSSPYRAFFKMFISICAGALVIYSAGVIYLYFCTKYFMGKEISFTVAVWSGFIIFIPVSLIKIALASYLSVRIKRRLKIFI